MAEGCFSWVVFLLGGNRQDTRIRGFRENSLRGGNNWKEDYLNYVLLRKIRQWLRRTKQAWVRYPIRKILPSTAMTCNKVHKIPSLNRFNRETCNNHPSSRRPLDDNDKSRGISRCWAKLVFLSTLRTRESLDIELSVAVRRIEPTKPPSASHLNGQLTQSRLTMDTKLAHLPTHRQIIPVPSPAEGPTLPNERRMQMKNSKLQSFFGHLPLTRGFPFVSYSGWPVANFDDGYLEEEPTCRLLVNRVLLMRPALIGRVFEPTEGKERNVAIRGRSISCWGN